MRNPQVHPRLCFPASSTSGLRAGNPSLFLCFEQVCTKVFFAFLASGVGVPVNEAGLSGNQPPILGNPSPALGKSAFDFGEIRRNPSPILPPALGKSATDFGKISHRLWGKTGSVLGKDWLAFRERLDRFGRNWFGFWIGLRQSSSLTVLNAKYPKTGAGSPLPSSLLQVAQIAFNSPWCLLVLPWCLPGCPNGPFLPPWCIPGCLNDPFLPPCSLPGCLKWSFPASLVPPSLPN